MGRNFSRRGGTKVLALVRRLAGWGLRRLLPEEEPARVLPFVLRWGKVRVRALMLRRGLVRGTVIVWPQSGRAWAMGRDIVRPAKGEVLVRMAASAVSPGTERAFFTRSPNAVTMFPSFPGYSAAGEVVAVGKRVTRVRPKDRVALVAPHGSIAVARVAGVYPVPPTVSFEEAAFIQLGIIALQAVQKADLRPGEPVVVLGHGLIGQLLVQLAAVFGAYPVISVSRTAKRLTDSLLRTAQRVVVLERDGAGGLGRLDGAVTIDATGTPDGLPVAIQCTRTGGRIVLAGSTRGVTEQADFGLLADKAITVVGAHISSLHPSAWPVAAQTFFTLLEQKRIDVVSLISERAHPLEAEWFYRRLSGRDDATIGAVWCWDRLDPAERLRRVSFLTPPDLAPFRRGKMSTKPLSYRLRQREAGVRR